MFQFVRFVQEPTPPPNHLRGGLPVFRWAGSQAALMTNSRLHRPSRSPRQRAIGARNSSSCSRLIRRRMSFHLHCFACVADYYWLIASLGFGLMSSGLKFLKNELGLLDVSGPDNKACSSTCSTCVYARNFVNGDPALDAACFKLLLKQICFKRACRLMHHDRRLIGRWTPRNHRRCRPIVAERDMPWRTVKNRRSTLRTAALAGAKIVATNRTLPRALGP